MTEKAALMEKLRNKVDAAVWDLVKDLQNKNAEKDKRLSEATAAVCDCIEWCIRRVRE